MILWQYAPDLTLERFDLSASDLYEQFMRDRPKDGIRTLTFDEVIATAEDMYRQQMEFMLSRGGPTDEELVAYGTARGTNLTARQIRRIQSLWRRQAGEQVDAYVIEQFRSRQPDFAAGAATDFMCIHDLLSEEDLLAYRLRETLDGKHHTSAEFEEMERVIATNDRRNAFALLIADLDRITKVGETDDPIPVDIYLSKSRSNTRGRPR